MKTKKELRDIYQNKRYCFSNNKIEDLSIAISNKCLDIPIWNMENFHVYLSILIKKEIDTSPFCLLYTSPSPRDATLSRMPSSA